MGENVDARHRKESSDFLESDSITCSTTSSEVEEETSESDLSAGSNKKINLVPLKTDGELLDLDQDLPPVENLEITVPKKECMLLGDIFDIVGHLVLVKAIKDLPLVDIDTVLFLDKGESALGQVYDIVGPMNEPVYCIRFNSKEHIKEMNFNYGDAVYCAPKTIYTNYVLAPHALPTENRDVSWFKPNGPPKDKFSSSDDEPEKKGGPAAKFGKGKIKRNTKSEGNDAPEISHDNVPKILPVTIAEPWTKSKENDLSWSNNVGRNFRGQNQNNCGVLSNKNSEVPTSCNAYKDEKTTSHCIIQQPRFKPQPDLLQHHSYSQSKWTANSSKPQPASFRKRSNEILPFSAAYTPNMSKFPFPPPSQPSFSNARPSICPTPPNVGPPVCPTPPSATSSMCGTPPNGMPPMVHSSFSKNRSQICPAYPYAVPYAYQSGTPPPMCSQPNAAPTICSSAQYNAGFMACSSEPNAAPAVYSSPQPNAALAIYSSQRHTAPVMYPSNQLNAAPGMCSFNQPDVVPTMFQSLSSNLGPNEAGIVFQSPPETQICPQSVPNSGPFLSNCKSTVYQSFTTAIGSPGHQSPSSNIEPSVFQPPPSSATSPVFQPHPGNLESPAFQSSQSNLVPFMFQPVTSVGSSFHNSSSNPVPLMFLHPDPNVGPHIGQSVISNAEIQMYQTVSPYNEPLMYQPVMPNADPLLYQPVASSNIPFEHHSQTLNYSHVYVYPSSDESAPTYQYPAINI